MLQPECLFDYENVDPDSVIAENELAYARWAIEPGSEGHTEIFPKRHEESFLRLEEEEFVAIYGLTLVVKELIVAQYKPDGFNLGVNEGDASGRLVSHTSFHVMPRYEGDVPNPRGGVRYVLPDKGSY